MLRSRRLALVVSVPLVSSAVAAACGGNVVLDSLGAGAGPTTTSSAGGAGGVSTTNVGQVGVGPSSTGTGLVGSTTVASTGVTTTVASSGVITTGVSSGVTATVASSGFTTTVGSSGGICPSQTPPVGPCSSPPSCPGSKSPCLAVVEPGGAPTFGLRMAHVSIALPAALAAGSIQTTIQNSVAPSIPACNLLGAGTFSWLLRFDTLAGTLTMGGARPTMSPFAPYTFDQEVVLSGTTKFVVGPVTLKAPFFDCMVDSTAGDVVIPIYLDQAGTQSVLFPLHQVSFSSGAVSGQHDCIGSYNAEGLSPANKCQPTPGIPEFFDGAVVQGFFNIAETDNVVVSPLSESLCVLLSGNPQKFGDGATPVAHCKKDPTGLILFTGDWCASTNQPATSACSNGLRFVAKFAASAVTIL